MKKRLIALLMVMLVVFCAAACGGNEGNTGVEAQSINVYNWGEYIDQSVLDDFTAETGIKVNYTTYASNEEMYSKIVSGAASYDVIIPSEYMIERMIGEGLLAELNHENIPNMANLSEYVLDRDFDPGNKYSVPYMWGTVGIVYNKTMVNGEITSWSDLWDPQYEGQIFMMNSVRDSMAVSLMTLGLSEAEAEERILEGFLN